MKSVHWEEVIPHDSDVNTIFSSFYSTITNIVDKHVPLQKLSKRQIKLNSKPWITPGIKVSIHNKNKLFQKYLKTKSSSYLFIYWIFLFVLCFVLFCFVVCV